MLINLYDRDLEIIYVIPEFVSAIFGISLYDVADFEVEVSYSEKLKSALDEAEYIAASPVYPYVIEKVEIVKEDSSTLIRVTGRDLKALLESRQIPQGISYTGDNSVIADFNETLTAAMISPVDDLRKVDVTNNYAPDGGQSAHVPVAQTDAVSLREALTLQAKAYESGYFVYFADTTDATTGWVKKGLAVANLPMNGRQDAPFSEGLGNVMVSAWQISKNQGKTAAYVKEGKDEGVFVEVADRTTSGIARKEMLTESETTLVNDDYSPAEARRLIIRSGHRAINATQASDIVNYQVKADGRFSLDALPESTATGYLFCGDTVRIDLDGDGTFTDARIVGVTVSESLGSPGVYLELSTETDSNTTAVSATFPGYQDFLTSIYTITGLPPEEFVSFAPGWRYPFADVIGTVGEFGTTAARVYIWGEYNQAGEPELFWYSPANTVYLPADSSYLFAGFGFKTVDLTGFDASRVTSISHLFDGCSTIEAVDLTMLEFGNTTLSADYAFANTRELRRVKLPEASYRGGNMFANAGMGSLSELEIKGEFTACDYMFYRCFYNDGALTSLDLSECDFSGVTSITAFLSNAPQLKTVYWNADKPLVQSGITDSTDLFYYDINLVGGNGTKFTGAMASDKTYARIDTASTPGLFTQKSAE